MNPVFIIAGAITILYCLGKYVEIKYFTQDEKPMKEVVRDALMVLVASITGTYVFFNFQTYISDFFNVVTETKVLNVATTQVFTDVPAF